MITKKITSDFFVNLNLIKISINSMKTKFFIYPQPNYLTRTAIEREQKQFIKIAFAVHLSAVISAERYRSDSGVLKSAVLNFVFFMIIINKIRQSICQICLKNNLLLNRSTKRTFENTPMKKVHPYTFFIPGYTHRHPWR